MARRKHVPVESSKRAQILSAAQSLFVEQGYDQVSMDLLARKVPVSKRTLYNHFEDKRALFVAVMQNRCNFIAQNIERILTRDAADVGRTLTRMGEHFLAVVLDPHAINIYRTAIAQCAHFPEMGRLFYESGPLRCKRLLADYLKRLHDQKRLAVGDPHYAADVFFSLLAGKMQMRLLLGVEKRIHQRELKKHIAYAVRLFLRGPEP